ncbi:putative baseplate assembly protein [Cellulomonas xiejunii]|uniref:putative baseplate assembly protein n=1 Tax=Cellulomonas xiejunii TaxID=2968083 RepID=UPI001D0EC781|nr:putative baseplate assembly protein [Cellulomonas xiejunii]MCC2315945.1 putative baseplate assembly protein [Cellulomonas xiejunii]
MPPLDPPNLDDRRFQDIVDETKRLIPRFTPEWTNHNLSDPGVALVELFAWVGEMVLYRVNQVPDRMYSHFLGLVGVEPFPPSVAHTRLTFRLAAPATEPVVVPEGTAVSTVTVGGQEPVVFATSAEAVAVPPRLVAARTAGPDGAASTDAWEPLQVPGESVRCFPSSPIRDGDAFYLGCTDPLADLVLRLDVTAHAEGIGVDPTRPPLAWEVWSGEAWVPTVVDEDTTGGLNRDGAVTLLVGDRHAPLTIGGTTAYWLRARLLDRADGRPAYQASPHVGSVQVRTVGVSVPAEHAQAMPAEVLGRSDGRPGQRFAVSAAPVATRRGDERVVVVDHTGATEWDEVPDFSASGPDDRHVVWDSASGEVRFGPAVRQPDGRTRQHGAVPPDGAQVRVTGYRTGGGSRGNVGARTVTSLRTALPSVRSVANLVPATGGVDAETVDEAKVRGPLALRTGQRAVTASDFEQVARQASVEVARARCLPVPPDGPARPVHVLLVPQVRTDPRTHTIDDFVLSPRLLDVVAAELDLRRTVGVSVGLGAPFYHGVSVAALVRAVPGRPVQAVRERVVEAVTRFVHPLVGGPQGTGWPFGQTLTATAVAQVAEGVDGVLGVDEVTLFGYDLRNGRRVGEGRESLTIDADTLLLSAEHRVVVR